MLSGLYLNSILEAYCGTMRLAIAAAALSCLLLHEQTTTNNSNNTGPRILILRKNTKIIFENSRNFPTVEPAAFLKEYCHVFSLAGLQRITGINQAQLGHYLHGRRKPSRKTVERISAGVKKFVNEISGFQFA